MCDQFNVILLDFLVEKKIKKTKDQIVKQGKTIWPLSNHGKNVFYSTYFSSSSFTVLKRFFNSIAPFYDQLSIV